MTGKTFLRAAVIATVAAFAASSPAVAQTVPGPQPELRAGIRTVKPGAGEDATFYMWRASGFTITEYRLSTDQLADSLRQGSLAIDTAGLTPRRRVSVSGQQGSMAITTRTGAYVYVADDGAGQRQAQAVFVSRLDLGVKRDDDRSVVLASIGSFGARGARITLLESNDPNAAPSAIGSYFISGTTGAIAVPTPQTGTITYLAQRGSEYAIQTAYDRSWSRGNDFIAHVQTDRPLYRPGDVVRWKAIVREVIEPSSSHRTPVDEPFRVFLRDKDGNRLSLGEVRTSPFGTIAGDYQLAETAGIGEYTLEVERTQAGLDPWLAIIGRLGFGVQEYRKPEYEVSVVTTQDSFVQGSRIAATIDARYFFGAPVPDALVTWTVKKSPRYRFWNPWIEPVFFRIAAPDIWFPYPIGGDEVVATGTARTGMDGLANIAFDATRGDVYDSTYTISAKVVDASDREVTGAKSVSVTRAAFDLVLQTDRYVYEPGDYVRVQANLANEDGTPTSGQRVTFEVFQLDEKGGRNFRFDIDRTTGFDGTASLLLLAQNKNRYVINAKATDASGNEISSERTVWVHDDRGGTDWSFGSVEITADKDVYQVGDDALLLIRAPITSGRGVLTLESASIKRALAFPIVFGLGLVRVRITEDLSPNIFASVMIPSDDGIKTASEELIVPPVGKVINVTVEADKAEYRPGEQATFRVRATDRAGNPVRAEVSLGVVDEALFALREDATPALVDTFYPKVYQQVQTLGGNGGVIFFGGPRILTAAAAPEAARADASRRTAEVQVRSFFPDTLRWVAQVVTDQAGEAVITQTMADNLTTWRMTALAVTGDTRVGETRSEVLVTKDLIVRLATPRTLVEGDELTLVGIVHNLADEGTPGSTPASVSVQLQTDGITILDGDARSVSVDRGGQARVSWKLRVDAADVAQVQATAIAGFDADALRLTLPVAARGVPVKDVQAGAMRADGTVNLTLTRLPGAITDATELSINLNPSIAGTMLESLDYLVGYPYGCIEQTMSKFFPTVLVADVLRTIGREDPNLTAQLPELVGAGVERIQGMQNADGGFGWFANNGSHPFTSAYVCMGLAIARRNGYAVPDELLDGVIRFLESNLAGASADPNGRAYQLFALSTAGVERRSDAVALARDPSRLSNYSKAVLAIALQQAGQNTLASDLVGRLAGDAVRTAGKAHWEGDTLLSYGNWTSNPVETTAYVLQAFVAVDPANALVADAVAWLVGRRAANGQYVTTKDTAAVVLALANYVKVTNELDPDLTVTVKVNGGNPIQRRFTMVDMAKKGTTIEIPGTALRAGANTVEITRAGRGVLYYSATLDQVVRMDPIPAADNGISVRRSYFKVTTRLDPQTNQLVEDETPLTGDVHLGDTIRVKLDVAVSRGAEVEHVNIEDYFPVGFEVVQEEQPNFGWWSWWRSAREVHDDRVVFFATRLGLRHPDDGGQSFAYSYDLRAEVAGRFLALPARAEAVYAPDTNGRSAATVVNITR